MNNRGNPRQEISAEGFPMKIHEYPAKDLLRQFNVPVPQGDVAATSREARQMAEELAEGPFVIKAQIHTGGRGPGELLWDHQYFSPPL
jgi:hypothetical protein